MVQIAITLGPNCKKLEHNWAFLALLEAKRSKVKFSEVVLHAKSMQSRRRLSAIRQTRLLHFLFHFQTPDSDSITYLNQSFLDLTSKTLN